VDGGVAEDFEALVESVCACFTEPDAEDVALEHLLSSRRVDRLPGYECREWVVYFFVRRFCALCVGPEVRLVRGLESMYMG